MLNKNVSIWDAEKTCRRPRTETLESKNTVSVDWDSFKTRRMPRTENNVRKAVNMVNSTYVQSITETTNNEEVINNDKPDVPGAMSLTTRELRGIGLA